MPRTVACETWPSRQEPTQQLFQQRGAHAEVGQLALPCVAEGQRPIGEAEEGAQLRVAVTQAPGRDAGACRHRESRVDHAAVVVALEGEARGLVAGAEQQGDVELGQLDLGAEVGEAPQ